MASKIQARIDLHEETHHFADITNPFCHPSFHSFCLLFNHNLSEVIVQNALMDPIMKNKNAYLVHVFEKVQKNICTFSITKVLQFLCKVCIPSFNNQIESDIFASIQSSFCHHRQIVTT